MGKAVDAACRSCNPLPSPLGTVSSFGYGNPNEAETHCTYDDQARILTMVRVREGANSNSPPLIATRGAHLK
ncbi:hypothetical protein OIU77_007351 [Salix suchowensis]|uniref:Uncharacterized protein n=1 Tax=Salix suchowensis TaxID=1278906 RepID=A0ABQ9AGZ9_9ROSI|nr:hypothetical protein OIU77_007351 [Salix suchowensis]